MQALQQYIVAFLLYCLVALVWIGLPKILF